MFNNIDFRIGFFSLRPMDHILMAKSGDGLTWKKIGRTLISPQNPQQMVYDPWVIREKSGGYLMNYTFGTASGSRTGIGIAHSKDGVVWKKIDSLIERDGLPIISSFSPIGHLDEGLKIVVEKVPGDYSSISLFRFQERKAVAEKRIRLREFVTKAVPIQNGEEIDLYVTLSDWNCARSRIEIMRVDSEFKVLGRRVVLKPEEEGGYFQNCFPLLDGGKFRLYFSESSAPLSMKNVFNGSYKMKIKSAMSYDGNTFVRDNGVRLDTDLSYCTYGCHSPYVIKEREGYLMFYSGYWGVYLAWPFQFMRHLLRKKDD